MTNYERKAIERCVRPVQMAIDALSLPPRKEEEMSTFRKTKHGLALCPFITWESEDIRLELGHREESVSLTHCIHPRNTDTYEGNCRKDVCPISH